MVEGRDVTGRYHVCQILASTGEDASGVGKPTNASVSKAGADNIVKKIWTNVIMLAGA